MTLKFKAPMFRIGLVFVMLISSLSVLFGCAQIKKGINAMSENKKVTEIKIGETYTMSWSKSDVIEKERRFNYIKLLDDKTFMKVSDDTQLSKEYYEGDGDSKTITLIIGTYEKEGDNFIQKSYVSYQTLVFSSDIDVKQGANGKVNDFMSGNELFDNGKISMTAIEKYDKYYRLNKANLKGSIPSDPLRVSEVKLPDSAEAFLAQYNLVDPQAEKAKAKAEAERLYWRSDEGQDEMARAFGFDIPVFEDDDGFKIFGF
ncbi:hypothetical protein FACS1894192_12400 [Bacilli bacterium]|nr:hypothetical protein FACS1894192_12400 [Bacilli bacterium]GHU45264.1 hypothetical protein FACS1894194_0610 [Bacilli bacterium]